MNEGKENEEWKKMSLQETQETGRKKYKELTWPFKERRKEVRLD